jgi:transposase
MGKKTRRKFTKEFKAEVVKLVLDGGRSVPDVCRQHDLSESSVYLWVKQAQVDRGDGPAGALTSAEKEELSQLRRECRELRRERDFLQQATAYFARAKK